MVEKLNQSYVGAYPGQAGPSSVRLENETTIRARHSQARNPAKVPVKP